MKIKKRNNLMINNETSYDNTYNDKKVINIKNYNDQEMNSLIYQEALKIDRRTFIDYYFSLLKRKQMIIFTFYTSNDYNARSMKIILFLFCFALYYAVNTLFFNDNTMHKIYMDEGKYNFMNQIKNILYSTLISNFIRAILKYLSLSENNIIELKQNLSNNIEKMKKCLKVKFILFFMLNFMLLVLFWYYISCFCAVYKNTQMHLIKDTLISFGLSLTYPFFLFLLPGLLRIPSLRSSKQNKECIYKISIFVQSVI
jgi:hypothetical protein